MVTRTCPGERSSSRTFRTKGLARADMATRRRWAEDGYRLSTFQYEADTILWKGDQWRLPSPDELDALLGFPVGYTDVPGISSLQREQLIGNTMHVEALRRLLQDLDLAVWPQHKPEIQEVENKVLQVDTCVILNAMYVGIPRGGPLL